MSPALPPLPVLLTKAEALEYAAKLLTEMGSHIELSSAIVAMMKPGDAAALPEATRRLYERTKAGLVDPPLQIAAAKSAGQAIRDLALEERLVSARVAAGAGVVQ